MFLLRFLLLRSSVEAETKWAARPFEKQLFMFPKDGYYAQKPSLSPPLRPAPQGSAPRAPRPPPFASETPSNDASIRTRTTLARGTGLFPRLPGEASGASHQHETETRGAIPGPRPPPADWLLPPPLLGPPRRRGPDGARRPSSAPPWPVKVSSSEGIRRCQGVRDREGVKTPHLSPYWTCKDPEQRARYEFLLKLFRRTTVMRSRDGAGRGSAEISWE